MKKIFLTTLFLITTVFAQESAVKLSQDTTKERIEMKLKELGFCCNAKNIFKIQKIAKTTMTDRELEDIILEYM